MNKALFRIIVVLTISVILLVGAGFWFLTTPNFPSSRLFPMTHRPLIKDLQQHVYTLASLKPNRSVYHIESLKKAARYIEWHVQKMGLKVERQPVDLGGFSSDNLIIKFEPDDGSEGKPIIVVGAHYDVAGETSPGADDNASGVSGLMELARMLQNNKPELKYPIHLVAYTSEEPPYFATDRMGSYVHAQSLKEQGQSVRMMLSLEMIGYFSEESFSQSFPFPLLYLMYPNRGNFISLVGRSTETKAVQEVKGSFEAISGLEVRSITAPDWLVGIDFSDHRNYWPHGWPALMVTDTAFYRNDHYHEDSDTPDRLDYEKMSLVVQAVYNAILNLE